MNYADQIINAFGGATATARYFGISQPSVSEWRKRGTIPRARLRHLQDVRPDVLPAHLRAKPATVVEQTQTVTMALLRQAESWANEAGATLTFNGGIPGVDTWPDGPPSVLLSCAIQLCELLRSAPDFEQALHNLAQGSDTHQKYAQNASASTDASETGAPA